MSIKINGVEIGIPGPAGKSAYQAAKDAGFTGSEAEFNQSIAFVKDKQNKLSGTKGQIIGFDDNGDAVAQSKPTYTASEVGALPSSTSIPSKTSQLTNDSGFITGYTETDPTVPSWAKAPSKPTYTASEVGAAPSSHASNSNIHITSDERTAWNAKADAPFKPAGKSYLTFSSPNSFTMAVNDSAKHWDGTLEYFASDKTWTTWDGTTTLSSVENDGEYVLYMRGTGNTKITVNISDYKWVLTGSDISCIGNIENLLDYATVQSGNHPTMANYCYYYMFEGCTSLTKAPALPATTLANQCYRSMFQGCTSLTKAPALPATTLAESCYQSMFNGCTSLTQAPALPATTLAGSCYYYMFHGCTSLTQAPALPATTLAGSCYNGMFSGCTSLTQAPALPATTLAINCYKAMFEGCTSLTQAPALPATTLKSSCYDYMFRRCTSLTQAPALPATTLAERCYYDMFYGCTSLTKAPALPATTLATNCYGYMFRGCTSLTQAPILPATTLEKYCYQSMFEGCTSLKLSSTKTGEYTQEYRIPSTGEGTTVANALTGMFASTGGTFTGTPDINTTYYLSSENSIVGEEHAHIINQDIHVTAEEKEKWNNNTNAPFKPAGKSYLTFSSPNSFTLKVNDTTKHWDGTLEYFSSGRAWTVWDGTTTIGAVDNGGEYVLYLRGTGNTKITGNNEDYRWVLTGSDIACVGNIETLLDYATVEAGNHPTMAARCYAYMFQATSLTQAPSLPATTLTDGCYGFMFAGCTSLTQAPALPATTLTDGCYAFMFYGCASLTQAPPLPATTLTDSCYAIMFAGCTSLTQAPALPATTLANQCYYDMFSGCTSLTQAPALPATTLAPSCYHTMFSGCTSLKLSATKTEEYTIKYRIPMSGEGTTATGALTDMFAETGGTFTGTPEINTTYYLSSDNMVVRETDIATLNSYVSSMIDAAGPKTVAVTLSASTWDSSALTQSVIVSGVLADETAQLIIPTPALASQTAYYKAGILCTGQAANSLTFTATTVPTVDLTVYVVIQDVVPLPPSS